MLQVRIAFITLLPALALAKAPPRSTKLSPLETRLLPKKHAAVPELTKLLSGGKPADQLDAASLLTWIRAPEAADVLKSTCAGASPGELRQQACFALSTLLLVDGKDLVDPDAAGKLLTGHLEQMVKGLPSAGKAATGCLGAKGLVVHPSHVPPGFTAKVSKSAAGAAEDLLSFHASASEGDFYGAISGGGECGVQFLTLRSLGDMARVAAVVAPPGADALPLTFVSLFRKDGDKWTLMDDGTPIAKQGVRCGASVCPPFERDYHRVGLWDPVKLALTENALGRLGVTPPANVTPGLFRIEAEPKPQLDRGDAALLGAFADYDSPVIQSAVDFRLLEWTSKPPRHEPLLKVLAVPSSDYLRLAMLRPIAPTGEVPIPLATQIIGSAGNPELRSAAVRAYGASVVNELKEASSLPADEAAAKFAKLQGGGRSAFLWDTSESLNGKDSKEACYAALAEIAKVGLKAYGEHGRNKENSEVEAVLPPSAKPQEVTDVLFWGDFASIETHNRQNFSSDHHDKGGTYLFAQMQRHWYLLGASGWMH